jgi:hypothetical protein
LYHPTHKVDRPYVSPTTARAEYKITKQSKMPATTSKPSKMIAVSAKNKNTVGYCMLLQIQTVCKTFSDIQQRDLLPYLFDDTEETDEVVEKHFVSAMLYLAEYHKTELSTLNSRQRKGHTGGNCYANAYDEWKRTGNEPVMVMEVYNIGSKYFSIAPHGCNKDKVTGEIYDTADFVSKKHHQVRPCYVVRDTEEMKTWLTLWKAGNRVDIPTMTFGHWDLVAFGDDLFSIQTTSTNPLRNDNVRTTVQVNRYKCDDLLALRPKHPWM